MKTTIEAIESGTYRISTSLDVMPGGFTVNQYLLVDEEPLLFHTGMRRMFGEVRDAVKQVIDPAKLRWISFSHTEADECGSLNEWLAVAPNASPLCSRLAAMLSIGDFADRPPRALADGEGLVIGQKKLRWIDAPHLPHASDTGYLFETTTRTLLCGDLFAQPGGDHPPVTEGDIFGPSEALRKGFPAGFAIERSTTALLEKLAKTEPRLLACMHGAAYRGDGGALFRALAEAL